MIVESPTKAKKISNFLGPDWEVKASVGHVRDLPTKRLAVDRDGDYALTYEVIDGKDPVVKALRAAVRAAGPEVYLGTDPDREGEAIAWHLQQLLELRDPKRVTFGEITPGVVRAAIAKPRRIDRGLVQAQEARRALDRLVGYDVSSALRRKLGRPMSAGRVQTIGLRLVVDREEEIRAFVSRHHHGVVLIFAADPSWTAEWSFKGLLPPGEMLWTDTAFADRVAALRDVTVTRCEEKVTRKAPPAPYTTSTLQQAGSNRLRYGAKKTMQIAQRLFENGLITYHRTDSPNLSDEAVSAIREYAMANTLPLPDAQRTWKAKEAAQGAHEAIRPTDVALEDARLHPDPDHRARSDEEQALYDLIRRRAIASQLADAEFDVRVVTLDAGVLDGMQIVFVARGSTLRKPGFKAFLADDATEDAKEEPDAKNPVPRLDEGARLHAEAGKRLDKKTEPPGRYTEATLVRALEDRGVGRPSTYASIVETIKAREYVEERKDRKFFPTPTGEDVIHALRGSFAFVEITFTRGMEENLDAIAAGKAGYLEVVRAADAGLLAEIARFAPRPAPGQTAGACSACGKGAITKRTRKDGSGVFWSCSTYPACTATFPDLNGKPNMMPRVPPVEGRTCPKCRKARLRLRNGSKGPFWGCAAYPSCKATYEDRDGTPNTNVAPAKRTRKTG